MNKTRLKLLVVLGLFGIFPSIILAQNSQKHTVIDFNLHYKDKQITIVSIDKRQGYQPDNRNQPDKDYTLQLLDKNSKEIFRVKFNFPLEITSDNFSGSQPTGKTEVLTAVDHTVTTTYLPDAKKINIIDPEGKIVASQVLNFESLRTEDQKMQQKEQVQGFLEKILGSVKNFFLSIINFINNIF